MFRYEGFRSSTPTKVGKLQRQSVNDAERPKAMAYGKLAAMPAGAVPQFVFRLVGTHRAGILRDTTKVFQSHGASIAALEKIRLGTQFVALGHLWSPTDLSKNVLTRELEQHVGCKCVVDDIDDDSRQSYLNALPERRLTITAPHHPELVVAITELLAAQGCVIGKLETKTFLEENTLKFFLNARVQTLTADKADAIERELKFIMDLNPGLHITFDHSNEINAFGEHP